jgi:hypothetical protein
MLLLMSYNPVRFQRRRECCDCQGSSCHGPLFLWQPERMLLDV